MSPNVIPCVWIIASILVVFGALICERKFKVPEIDLLASIGDASYVIYLIHTPVVQIVKVQKWLPVGSQIVAAVFVCVTLGLGLQPLEKKIVRYTRQRLNQGLAAVMVFIPIAK
jgi:peptidoglycan/LPS O-acetylase OafA/YrhL